ncbi:MAG: cyclic pyranopterin monophosphate synthase MoaC [Candidatus Eiseniibacteriota bacterium]|nr:MAG: cyclic pyranopterin monophosphate synthase MoaC [Candidatus Eisenbacteria bacterium]
MKRFSHIDSLGRARMVDVSGKKASSRRAVAEAIVRVGPEVAKLLSEKGEVKKGDVLETARIAGIMAAKRTPELIPLCHPLPLDYVDVYCTVGRTNVTITTSASTTAKTGVEMECMVAAAVAGLTVYDMCKSAGKDIEIRSVRLLEKSGGKSGSWRR